MIKIVTEIGDVNVSIDEAQMIDDLPHARFLANKIDQHFRKRAKVMIMSPLTIPKGFKHG